MPARVRSKDVVLQPTADSWGGKSTPYARHLCIDQMRGRLRLAQSRRYRKDINSDGNRRVERFRRPWNEDTKGWVGTDQTRTFSDRRPTDYAAQRFG